MRERRVLWVVLAGIVAGAAAIAAVAGTGGGGGPSRLPALAFGPAATGGAAEAKAAFPFPGEVRYEVKGTLPDLSGTAPTWTVGEDVDLARVRELARALGLAGDVESGPDGWMVRDGPRQLTVTRAPGLPWFYAANAPEPCPEPQTPPETEPGPDQPVGSGPSACVVAEAGVAATGTAGGSVVEPGDAGEEPATGSPDRSRAQTVPAEPGEQRAPTYTCPPPPCPEGAVCEAPPCPPPPPTTSLEPCPMPDCPPGTACIQRCGPIERPADLPTKEEAERVARDLLRRVGLDLTGAGIQVDDGFSAWYVTARPTLGGLPVWGWEWTATVGPRGEVAGASGWLGRPERGKDYPLAGTATGLARLRSGLPLGYGGWSPYPQPAAPEDVRPLSPGTPQTLIAPECEDCPPPEPVVRTVTGVRLGLAFAPEFREEAATGWFVPAYLFEIDGNEVVPVIAVADEFLPPPPAPAAREPGVKEPPPAVEPGAEPGTEPAGPAGE